MKISVQNIILGALLVGVFVVAALYLGPLFYSLGGRSVMGGATRQEQKMLNVIVANVLDKELYDDCHIKDSIHLDIDKLDEFVQATAKNTPIVIYCSNYLCSTSDYVAKKLREKGFTDVFVYAGGMAEWYQNKLPVEGACAASYLTKPNRAPATQTEHDDIITLQKLMKFLDISI